MSLVTSKEVIEATGITTRQLDYWTSKGVIPTLYDSNPGSGNKRMYEDSVIKRVKFLLDLNEAFDTNFPTEFLSTMYDAYTRSYIELDNGFSLTWIIDTKPL